MSAKSSMKILVPLATASVAAAVAVGSGANWSSESTIKADITGGSLLQTFDHGGATLAITKLKPGWSEQGTVTLTEDTGNDLDTNLQMKLSGVTNNFLDNAVSLDVYAYDTDPATTTLDSSNLAGSFDLYNVAVALGDSNPANDAAASTLNLGRLLSGFGHKYLTFKVAMASNAEAGNMGKNAKATVTLSSTQTDAQEVASVDSSSGSPVDVPDTTVDWQPAP